MEKRKSNLSGSTRCRRCGKPLFVRKSVERGIGPKCWARLKRLGLSDEDLEIFGKAKRGKDWWEMLDWDTMPETWVRLPDDVKDKIRSAGLAPTVKEAEAG